MDWKKLAPWNWFKEEEASLPVSQSQSPPGFPSETFGDLRQEFDRLFDAAFTRNFPGMPRRAALPRLPDFPLRPNVDISEGKKAYTICAELPGIDREDVSIDVDGNTLLIRAEKRRDREEEDEGYHCVERSYGAVQRVLSLPEDADVDAINAKFKNGVLKLRIPKQAAVAGSRQQIEIEQG